MKAKLIIDSIGPNPAFRQPRRDDFRSDEAWHDAVALYDVPAEVIVPAGTILCDPLVWVHCYPDSNIGFHYDPKTGRRIPVRMGIGSVRAVPLDEGCLAALLKHIKHAAAARRTTVEAIQAEIKTAVEVSLARQVENDKANAAEAALAAKEQPGADGAERQTAAADLKTSLPIPDPSLPITEKP